MTKAKHQQLVSIDTPVLKHWLFLCEDISGSKLHMEQGWKFIKITKVTEVTPRPYCFINRVNGDVYKAAHDKYPAPGQVRGNIYSTVNPVQYMDMDGTRPAKRGVPKGYKYRCIFTRAKRVPYVYTPGGKPKVYKPRKRYRFIYKLRPVIRVTLNKSRQAIRYINPEYLLD